jgi:hypothetical protein
LVPPASASPRRSIEETAAAVIKLVEDRAAG